MAKKRRFLSVILIAALVILGGLSFFALSSSKKLGGSGILWPEHALLNSFTSITIAGKFDTDIKQSETGVSEEEFNELSFDTCSSVLKRAFLPSSWKLRNVTIKKASGEGDFASNPMNFGIVFYLKKAKKINPSTSQDKKMAMSFRLFKTKIAREYAQLNSSLGQVNFDLSQMPKDALTVEGGVDLPSDGMLIFESPMAGTGAQTQLFRETISQYCSYLLNELDPDFEVTSEIEKKIRDTLRKGR